MAQPKPPPPPPETRFDLFGHCPHCQRGQLSQDHVPESRQKEQLLTAIAGPVLTCRFCGFQGEPCRWSWNWQEVRP